jgi:hypothetical protein
VGGCDYVTGQFRELRSGPFVLVGHSMAGKVSMAIASLALQDLNPAIALEGLVLVASSPPTPEPMSDNKRAELIANLGAPGPHFRQKAQEFIRENTAEELAPTIFGSAVADVLRMNCNAWVAWLEHGSREDWAERIGMVTLPTLVIAGEKDKNLGADAQIRLVLPYLRAGRLEIVADSGHLVPMEQPAEIARLIAAFVSGLCGGDKREILAGAVAGLDAEYAALIASKRVSTQTRKALLERGEPDSPRYVPAMFSSGEMTTLRAIADRVVPMVGRHIDFAQRIDKRLTSGTARGWRFAMLPPDAEAYKLGLRSVELYARVRLGGPFATLTAEQQDALLESTSQGELELGIIDLGMTFLRPDGKEPDLSVLSDVQMQRWFEDLRADLTAMYVSHPATLSEMGYSGIADGGDAGRLTGFVQLEIGMKEDWEPEPHNGARA